MLMIPDFYDFMAYNDMSDERNINCRKQRSRNIGKSENNVSTQLLPNMLLDYMLHMCVIDKKSHHNFGYFKIFIGESFHVTVSQ